MSERPEKKAIIDEVRGRLDDAGYVLLADCRGLNVEGMGALRGKLREQGSSLLIVKNRLLGRASAEAGWEDIDPFLEGPTAVITGSGDVTSVARLLRDEAKADGLPAMKGGRFGDRTLDAGDVAAIADIPPREILLGQLVGTIAAPMTQAVGVMQQKVASLLYVLKAVVEKKSQ